MSKQIAFVTYETPYAPAGGVAAVMARLPEHVKKASALPTVVLTPYHHRIDKTRRLETREAGRVQVSVGSQVVNVSLQRFDTSLPWFFLKPDDPDYFSGFPHPYLVGNTKKDSSDRLCRDALLFGSAVNKALALIAPAGEWIVMLQDWEAATSVLAASRDSRLKFYLTLHNSYDAPVTDEELMRHGIDYREYPGFTVLDRALPYMGETVFTVSDQFAIDLTEDVFQAEVMAGHLRDKLKPRLLGVNNGPFVDLHIDADVLSAAARGDYRRLQDWKQCKRQAALSALVELKPSRARPVWGDLRRFDRNAQACWFVMAGRDDTRQKGYDVAASAVHAFFRDGGDARFFFFPIPGDEGLSGLAFLKRLAQKYPRQVLVFPFIWREGFLATLQGASFGLMPSLYEPFGMANEFYLNGTVGIGRATGGIIQQIVPLQSPSCYSQAAQSRAMLWHASSSAPTGILFRESDQLESSVADFRAINAVGYKSESSLDRVRERSRYQLFQAMSNELRISLHDGVQLFEQEPEQYYKMLVNGVQFIQHSISWERAAHEYVRSVGLTSH